MEDNKKYKILFVCLGNICRSPAGQGVMERIVDERGLNDRIFIDSAGISSYHSGDLPDQRMRVHATRRGLNLTHRSRQVCSDEFERFDLILAMDDSNYDHLRRLANSPDELDEVKRIASLFRQYRHWDCNPDHNASNSPKTYWQRPAQQSMYLWCDPPGSENLPLHAARYYR